MISGRSILRTGLAVTLLLSPVALASAGEDPIATRQNVMSNVGAAVKALGGMVRGQVDYDAAVAEQAMRSIASSAAAFPHYFTEGSETGGDTEALPIIWEKKDEFVAIAYKMEAAAIAGIDGAKTDLDSMKAAFGPVVENCKTCHETYRKADD